MRSFEECLTPVQREIWESLHSPADIQAFLDETLYSTEDVDRSPLSVMRDRVAHCLDGGLFAAAALRRLGYPPVLVDLLPDPGADDDHVLAIYKRRGCFGAVAKSNFVTLRFREPIYRTLRELIMTYFEVYFDVQGNKTLRSYTTPLNLTQFDRQDWLCNDETAWAIERRFATLRRTPLIDAEAAANLTQVDPLSYESGMLGVNPEGLYKPHRSAWRARIEGAASLPQASAPQGQA
jgi:hypothetical protein